MLKKWYLHKITNCMVNLAWLIALWYIVYSFTVWNYASSRLISSTDTVRQIIGMACDFTAWAVLLVEFCLNFPCRHFLVRFLCGVAAVLILLAMMPIL